MKINICQNNKNFALFPRDINSRVSERKANEFRKSSGNLFGTRERFVFGASFAGDLSVLKGVGRQVFGLTRTHPRSSVWRSKWF